MSFGSLPPFAQIMAVAVGGLVGSVARFFVSYFFGRWFGAGFPWGTLFVNVAGSLWLGWFGTLALAKPDAISVTTRLLLTTGFAGGFTTFSTFVFETMALYEQGNAGLAWSNIAANLVVGIVAGVIGVIVARWQVAS